jgi:hypothetical protein
MLDECQRYYQHFAKAGINTPETTFEIEAMTENGYAIIIDSTYIDNQNTSEDLYNFSDIKKILTAIRLVCAEYVKADCYSHHKLRENDLVMAIDSSPYNFIIDWGKNSPTIYHVDFFPPRNRLSADDNRINDNAIITDHPKPTDIEKEIHLRKCFYTRSGLWLHGLAHLSAAFISNHHIQETHATKNSMVLEIAYQSLESANLTSRIDFLRKNDSQEQLSAFIHKFVNHQHFYYERFMRNQRE